MIFFQGHPEYDKVSLLKEYKREVGLYVDGRRDSYPPYPEHYFDLHTVALLNEYRRHVLEAVAADRTIPSFPESQVLSRLENTWHDSGEAVVGNWIGQVYQLTHSDRRLPWMQGIDPNDPLGWLNRIETIKMGETASLEKVDAQL